MLYEKKVNIRIVQTDEKDGWRFFYNYLRYFRYLTYIGNRGGYLTFVCNRFLLPYTTTTPLFLFSNYYSAYTCGEMTLSSSRVLHNDLHTLWFVAKKASSSLSSSLMYNIKFVHLGGGFWRTLMTLAKRFVERDLKKNGTHILYVQ